jgi:hypothetical protein
VTRLRRERWLHTRISEDLEDALKREARRRRQPVSMLVRHVLEGALDLVEELVDEGKRFARRAAGQRVDDDAIYGWQGLVLNRDATCARCAVALAAGAGAWRGLSEHPTRPVFLCDACVRRLGRTARDGEEVAP